MNYLNNNKFKKGQKVFIPGQNTWGKVRSVVAEVDSMGRLYTIYFVEDERGNTTIVNAMEPANWYVLTKFEFIVIRLKEIFSIFKK